MKRIIRNCLLFSSLIIFLFACKSVKQRQAPEVFAYICQNGQEKPLNVEQAIVNVDAEPFYLRFLSKRYIAGKQQFHSMRIAAFLSDSQIPNIHPGLLIDSMACFGAGTGMASAHSGEYEVLNFNDRAHHYVYSRDESNHRAKLISSENKRLTLEFEVDSLGISGYNQPMSQTGLSEFYLLLFNDANLNRQIDDGEWSKVTIRLNNNYRGWNQLFWNQQDSLGQTPLHRMFLLKQWGECTDRQRQDILEQACRSSEVNLNLQDENGYTALHYALANYYLQNRVKKTFDINLIECLLRDDKCDINRANYSYCNNPLQDYLMLYETGSISARGIELIKLFLQRKDLKLNHQNNILYTAYDYAERKIWMDDINYGLVEQLKADTMYNNGATSGLWKIINQVDYNVTELDSGFFAQNIQLCLNYNANPNARQSPYSSTPLTALCNTRHRPYGYDENEIASNIRLRAVLINQLMHAAGCNVNQHDGEGLTALHHAVEGNNAELVKVLVKNTETDLNVQNKLGNTPLMDVLHNLRYRIGNELQTKSCVAYLTNDLDRIDLHIINYKGQTVMDILNDQLGRNEELGINASRFPELHKLLVEVSKKMNLL